MDDDLERRPWHPGENVKDREEYIREEIWKIFPTWEIKRYLRPWAAEGHKYCKPKGDELRDCMNNTSSHIMRIGCYRYFKALRDCQLNL